MASSFAFLIAIVMTIFTSVTSAVSIQGLKVTFDAIDPRNVHEFDPASKSTIIGRVVYLTTALVAFAILVLCFTKRSKNLNLNSIRNMNLLRILVIVIYILGLGFVISGTLLQLGVGLSTYNRCRAAIDLCLVFYVGGKVIVYVFLVERAHAIRAARYRRYQDWVWAVSMLIVVGGFGTIAVFAFLEPVVDVSELDGKCRIGLPLKITLPLLVYDILMNVGMTVLFFALVRPYLRNGMPNFMPVWVRRLHQKVQRTFNMKVSQVDPGEGALDKRGTLERLAWKSFVASIAILLSTVVNLSLLFHLKGRELGWLCYTVCTIDVTWSVIIIHLLTADPAELDSAPRNNEPAHGRRRSAFSIADVDGTSGS